MTLTPLSVGLSVTQSDSQLTQFDELNSVVGVMNYKPSTDWPTDNRFIDLSIDGRRSFILSFIDDDDRLIRL